MLVPINPNKEAAAVMTLDGLEFVFTYENQNQGVSAPFLLTQNS